MNMRELRVIDALVKGRSNSRLSLNLYLFRLFGNTSVDLDIFLINLINLRFNDLLGFNNSCNTLLSHQTDLLLQLALIIRGGLIFGRFGGGSDDFDLDLESGARLVNSPVISRGEILIVRDDDDVFLFILVSKLYVKALRESLGGLN